MIEIGHIVITPGARACVARATSGARAAFVMTDVLLTRHAYGDDGDIGQEDAAANVAARANGSRVMSVYAMPGVWVVTEADRSVTTILEY